jgi:TatD DNase family protein
MKGGQKLPFCHGGTLPWTAAFIAKVLNERESLSTPWTTEDVIRVCRDNAKKVYGI